MRYAIFERSRDFPDEPERTGVAFVVAEIDETGFVRREVGISRSGSIAYKVPGSSTPFGSRGMFDLVMFNIAAIEPDLSASDFEDLFRLDANEKAPRFNARG